METLQEIPLQENIVNRVTGSNLISIDLETYYPQGERVVLDIKGQLFQGLLLREKDFRAYIKATDWSKYQSKYVAIICSEDAIVPTWAYMLLAISLQPFAKKLVFGTLDALEQSLWDDIFFSFPIEEYHSAKVVIKGCSKQPVPVYAFTELARLLTPISASIMYGEPCSTVPLYKRKAF